MKKAISLDKLRECAHNQERILCSYKNYRLVAKLWEREIFGELYFGGGWNRQRTAMDLKEARDWWNQRVPPGWFGE